MAVAKVSLIGILIQIPLSPKYRGNRSSAGIIKINCRSNDKNTAVLT